MSLFGNAVGFAAKNFLLKTGDTMIGTLDMNGNTLTGIGAPTENTHAAHKLYVDRSMDYALDAALDAEDAAANAAQAAFAAQKTADGKAARLTFAVTLPASNWLGNAPPYSQTVTVEGIGANDEPHYGLIYSGTNEQKLAQKEAYACIDDLDTAENAVTFTCLEEKPTVNITIQMEVIR